MDFNSYQKSNQFLVPAEPVCYQVEPNLRRRKKGFWLWLILVLMILAVLTIFAVAVMAEVARRDAQLKVILTQVQKGTSASIIENSLIDQVAGQLTTTSSSAAGASLSSAGANDETRQLAEKLDRPHLGNVSSTLVIVEFGDFDCPVCLSAYPAIRAITAQYPKDLLFIFRNYPLISENSAMYAQASLCANDQGKFWALHDRLFMNQGKIASLDDFKNVVKMSGADWDKLEKCVNSGKYNNQVLQDTSDAMDLGVNGTPTFFINGKKLVGAVPQNTWEQIILKYKELNK